MGFDELATDPDLAPRIERLKKALEVPGYRLPGGASEAPDQIFENVDLDPLIPDHAEAEGPAARDQLLEALEDAETDVILIESFLRFCYSHGQEGPMVEPPAELGHVRSLAKLADWLSRDSPLDAREVASRLRDAVRLAEQQGQSEPGAASLRRASERHQKLLARFLGNRAMSPFPMWSFLGILEAEGPPDGHDSVGSVLDSGAENAIRRLGLGHLLDVDEVVGWGHRLPADQEIHRPTAWDAADNPHWRPGGTTHPLDGAEPNRGLLEGVHEPIEAKDLIHPLRILE